MFRGRSDQNVHVLDLAGAIQDSPLRDDGATLRVATAADVPAIAALTSEGIHPETVEEVWGLASVTNTPFLLAESGTDVVATMAVIEGRMEFLGHPIPFAQAEFVTTAPKARRQGLAGTLLGIMHTAAERAGLAFTLAAGTEYFYRQFGYEYAVAEPLEHTLVEIAPIADARFTCRLARRDDVPELDALQATVQRHADVTIPSTSARWHWLMDVGHISLVVAEREGRLDAMARVYADHYGVAVTEVAARSVPAADAVLHHISATHGGLPITVPDRPGGGAPFLDRRSERVLDRGAYYIRPTTTRLWLEALVPALNERLSRSAFASDSRTVDLSMYREGYTLGIVDGSIVHVGGFDPVGGAPDPSVSAIAPDLVATLALSDLGSIGLEERHPDVLLGDNRLIMRTLFPSVTADFLLY